MAGILKAPEKRGTVRFLAPQGVLERLDAVREQARMQGITVEIDHALSVALERLVSRAEKELAGQQESATETPARETSAADSVEATPLTSDVTATHGYM